MQLLLLLPPLGDDLQLHAAAALAASDRLLKIQKGAQSDAREKQTTKKFSLSLYYGDGLGQTFSSSHLLGALHEGTDPVDVVQLVELSTQTVESQPQLLLLRGVRLPRTKIIIISLTQYF